MTKPDKDTTKIKLYANIHDEHIATTSSTKYEQMKFNNILKSYTHHDPMGFTPGMH